MSRCPLARGGIFYAQTPVKTIFSEIFEKNGEEIHKIDTIF